MAQQAAEASHSGGWQTVPVEYLEPHGQARGRTMKQSIALVIATGASEKVCALSPVTRDGYPFHDQQTVAATDGQAVRYG